MPFLTPPAPPAAELPAVTLDMPDHEAWSGAALGIVTEMYRRIGYQVRESHLPARRALRDPDSGESDGEVMRAVAANQRFSDMIMIPGALFETDIVAFTAGHPALLPGGWADLRGRSVCTRPGIAPIEDELNTLSGVKVVFAGDTARIFLMLKAGRCDYAVLPRTAWIEARDAGIAGLAEASPILAHVTAYHAVSKRRAMLVPSLAAVMRQLRADGSIARAQTDLDAEIDAAEAESGLASQR